MFPTGFIFICLFTLVNGFWTIYLHEITAFYPFVDQRKWRDYILVYKFLHFPNEWKCMFLCTFPFNQLQTNTLQFQLLDMMPIFLMQFNDCILFKSCIVWWKIVLINFVIHILDSILDTMVASYFIYRATQGVVHFFFINNLLSKLKVYSLFILWHEFPPVLSI